MVFHLQLALRNAILPLTTLLCAQVSAQVTPIWSSNLSETVPYAANYASVVQTLTASGDALMIAGELDRIGLAGSVLLEADGATTHGQFGAYGLGTLRADAVLASGPDRVLLRMTERLNWFSLQPARTLVVMVDLLGQVQWAHTRHVNEARFLPDGDVVLSSGNELMCLRGGDGDLLWVRNLLPLLPNAVEARAPLPLTMQSALILGVHLTQRDAGVSSYPDPVYLALDLQSGNTLWQRQREASSAEDLPACGSMAVGSDAVFAWFDATGGQTDLVFERRRGDDGTRIWSTRVAAVAQGDSDCAVLTASSALAFAAHDPLTEQTTLLALGFNGDLRWRQTLSAEGAAKLLGAADGDLLLARPKLLPGDVRGTLIERRRGTDGAVSWSFPVAGNDISWSALHTELRIALAAIASGAARLQLRRYDMASGKPLSAQQADAEGVTLRPAQMRIIDGVPYAVATGVGADSRQLRVQRLDPVSGAVLWTRYHALNIDVGIVNSLQLLGVPQGGLLAVVSFHRPSEFTRGHQALLWMDRSSGELRWQRSLRAGYSGEAYLGAADGSLYVRFGECQNPPLCYQIADSYGRLAAVDGSDIWSLPGSVSFRALRGHDLLISRGTSNPVLALLAADDGRELWTHSLTYASYPATVAMDNGDLITAIPLALISPRKVEIERRLAVSGAPIWSVSPGAIDDAIDSARLSHLPNGDVLLSAEFAGSEAGQERRRRPLLARISASNGAVIWTQRPQLQGDLRHELHVLPGASSSHLWASSRRIVDAYQMQQRLALTSVTLSDGSIGAEHLYASNYDAPLTSPAPNLSTIAGVLADGSVQVEQAASDTRGLWVPRLQRWPAASGNSGDLRLRRLGAPGPITGASPSIGIDIEIENASSERVEGIQVGFASHEDDLKAQLRRCTLIIGDGQCPEHLGSALPQALALGANATIRLRYQIHDPDYRPGRSSLRYLSRGLFYADPPYTFGDADLGDNIAVIEMALGASMGDGVSP